MRVGTRFPAFIDAVDDAAELAFFDLQRRMPSSPQPKPGVVISWA